MLENCKKNGKHNFLKPKMVFSDILFCLTNCLKPKYEWTQNEFLSYLLENYLIHFQNSCILIVSIIDYR